MHNIKFALYIFLIATLSSCQFIYKNEYKDVKNALSDAIEYCNLINNETEDNIYNSGNFTQLCSMGGWPVNKETAKFFRANGAYNHAEMALAYIDKAINISYKINDNELTEKLQTVQSNLRQVSQYASIARENYLNYRYNENIVMVIGCVRNSITQIESCRRIIDNK